MAKTGSTWTCVLCGVTTWLANKPKKYRHTSCGNWMRPLD